MALCFHRCDDLFTWQIYEIILFRDEMGRLGDLGGNSMCFRPLVFHSPSWTSPRGIGLMHLTDAHVWRFLLYYGVVLSMTMTKFHLRQCALSLRFLRIAFLFQGAYLDFKTSFVSIIMSCPRRCAASHSPFSAAVSPQERAKWR
jgi:hypothetical protein